MLVIFCYAGPVFPALPRKQAPVLDGSKRHREASSRNVISKQRRETMKSTRFPLPLFATLAFIFGLAVCAQAQTYTDLANFNGQNGSGSNVPLIQATDGNFYGASGADTFGNIFQVTPSGKITAIYKFCSQPKCADGENPFWGPILGSDGNLYGVAQTGGSHAGSQYGSGTFYKMTLSGEITILYTFCSAGPCTDGQYPNGIILASDGNFYGTTYGGGQFNKGEIFQISATGNLKVLYSFCSLANCSDGFEPEAPPIQASNGNIYGVTHGGDGVVYELTPAGTYAMLHHFCSESGCKDGGQTTELVEGTNGNIFGTTVQGGSHDHGTVFEVTSTNQYIVLDSFDYLRGSPFAGLALANDGNLYGTTIGPGGVENGGTIYEITPEGRYTQLYTFTECSISGYNPVAPLFQGTDGLLYGTTLYGGNGTEGGCGGSGTIFTLANNLSPLVETVPVAGPTGKSVIILGNALTGSTSVTFNGVEAKFTVESDTYIKATVPAGATTGTVSVVTPSGTLNSNPQFVVTK
jgi:uncharacterized repeat protein (TIGR03803 family)